MRHGLRYNRRPLLCEVASATYGTPASGGALGIQLARVDAYRRLPARLSDKENLATLWATWSGG